MMRTYLKLIFTVFIFLTVTSCLVAQSDDASDKAGLEIGIEVQAYPTGIIPGVRIEKYLNSNSSLNFRVGYQIIDHRDLGVQENEEGTGYGVSMAYRRFLGSDYKGLSLAFRTDLWFNEIEWQNGRAEGISNITVVQPTIMGEYSFRPTSNISITPSLSFGWEWNATTDGAPTGEGAILLLGVSFGMGLK